MKEIFMEVILPMLGGLFIAVWLGSWTVTGYINLSNLIRSKKKYRIIKVNYSGTFRVQSSLFGLIWRTEEIERSEPGLYGGYYSITREFDSITDAENYIASCKGTPDFIKERDISIVKEEN